MTAGKKGKKEEITASDTFDLVNLGLHQAESAVLLLKSPEDDVKAKACEALYKFASKNEENKKSLNGFNVLEFLYPLLKCEDKVVKRNAVMLLSILASVPNIRIFIRKLPNIMSILLKLLDREEFDTTKEFVALALSNLCLEYISINELIERKGLQSVIECLKISDPDIQKNSLDVLFLVMQDFEARSLLKSFNGLENLLELLNSEYPIIQDLVLKIFSRASLDVSVRSALRDLDALHLFIDIIGNPEYNDIHVSALEVISNLLDDLECVKHLINQCSIQALFHFITDRQVYQNSDLKSNTDLQATQTKQDKNQAKPKKNSANKSVKKGKQNEEGIKDEGLSNTLPEAKIQACRALMRASRKEETRKLLHDADVERMLVALLSHDDEGVRTAAAQVIAVLSENALCQDRFTELGGLELLIRMTRSDHLEPKSAGVTALAALTTGNANNCREVASRNSGIEALISCLYVNDAEMDSITVGGLVALTNLGLEETIRHKVLHAVTAKLIVPTLNSTSVNVQSKAALATASLISETQTIKQFHELGGTKSLINLLQSDNNEVRRNASWAISLLVNDSLIVTELPQLDAITILQNINQSITRKNAFTELALNRILDMNLVSKFALTGYLDFADHIPDCFYDPGQMNSCSSLLSLQDYSLQPINDHRPIYLINVQQNFEENPNENQDQSSLICPLEINDNLKQMNNEDEYKIPFDTIMFSWINHTIKEILPVNDSIKQIQLLGDSTELYLLISLLDCSELLEDTQSKCIIFIANCYGGSISRDEQMNFRCELPLAQLRCELNSNILPLGLVKMGTYLHRAIVFKFLADRIGLPVNLIRGTYGRTYNQFLLNKTNKYNQVEKIIYIVDLMYKPGRLIETSSSAALEYISIAG